MYILRFFNKAKLLSFIGLILSITRRVAEGNKVTRSQSFTGWAPLYHLGTELSGKTLGIIEMVNIGRAVAMVAKALDMNIIYCTFHPLDEKEEKELGYEYKSFDELIKTADILTLHTSYNPSLYHMIDKHTLERMKSTEYLINLVRSPLANEAALLKVLKNEYIARAALHVYENEPKVTEGLKNLIT